ncbi:DUF4189 domain-containing protein [Pseudomonas sp. CGJS7]|uniref:DUF4189 domain-containing protein n=1 Tax=Pseudomonas sp. CGJS7 TaxID=3109348 RepID=UPI00300A3CBD
MRFFILSAITAATLTTVIPEAKGGCPPGQIPYTSTPAEGSAASIASCGPIRSNQPPPPQWETRWGAIASDQKGAYGIVTGMTSERRAEKAAVSQCKELGGISCAATFSFYNQCAAVVVTTTKSFAQSAAEEDQAIAVGKARCEDSGSGECWVYYSGCSLPVRTN